jgi:hypothetical protein
MSIAFKIQAISLSFHDSKSATESAGQEINLAMSDSFNGSHKANRTQSKTDSAQIKPKTVYIDRAMITSKPKRTAGQSWFFGAKA